MNPIFSPFFTAIPAEAENVAPKKARARVELRRNDFRVRGDIELNFGVGVPLAQVPRVQRRQAVSVVKWESFAAKNGTSQLPSAVSRLRERSTLF